VNFRSEKRTSGTHQSMKHADARLARKSHGTGSILGYSVSVLMHGQRRTLIHAGIAA